MNLAPVEPIVRAVLYEGYMLYPYRPSSLKNQQRWTFGGLYPHSYSLASGGSDAWLMQTECLAMGARPAMPPTRLDLKIRFLHLMARDIGVLATPLADLPPGVEPELQLVPALRVGETLLQSWQEAVEREVDITDVDLHALVARPQQRPFAFEASRTLEPLRAPDGPVIGVMMRTQQPIAGTIELAAVQLDATLFKICVRVLNQTPLAAELLHTRSAAQLQACISTHIILSLQSGSFVSLFDPPESLRDAVAACQNQGGWPVLVGDPDTHSMLLASPIILYDYPEIAPESPGDLFDGTEIDEILTLRILAMTDDEKREMADADERSRTLLARTEALAREQLMGLHGTLRGMRPLEHEESTTQG